MTTLLAQTRAWRADLSKGADSVLLAVQREGLPEDAGELRDLRIEIPLERWNAVVKHAPSDRKLLGGVLLDYASHKDKVATAIARDRLWAELIRVVGEATFALVGGGHLVLRAVAKESE